MIALSDVSKVALRIGGYLALIVVGTTAVFSFGASTYCLFALTGVAGIPRRIGASSCESYFQALAALLTPTIGAAAAYIAYQQHRTSRAKLKDDQYERRVLVLRGVLAFLGAVFRDGTVKAEQIPLLAQTIGESRYLFGKDLADYLEKIQRNARAIYTKENLSRNLSGGNTSLDLLLDQHSELVLWMTEQPEEVKRRFEPYLKITV